ncbi:MAG: hypothetical protein ACRDI2_13765, partial [Chloroflexota bacterium]
MAAEHIGQPVRRSAAQPLLAVAFLASGAALVIAIISGAPLGVVLGLLGLAAGLTVALRWTHADARGRALAGARLRVGLAAGILATGAYDGTRWLVVTLGGLQFWPFESFPLFGYLIAGQEIPRSAAYAVGTAYHLLNGLAFAISYSMLLGGRKWWWAVGWALGLEAAMLTIYPTWLNLDSVMKEFTAVSLLGH